MKLGEILFNWFDKIFHISVIFGKYGELGMDWTDIRVWKCEQIDALEGRIRTPIGKILFWFKLQECVRKSVTEMEKYPTSTLGVIDKAAQKLAPEIKKIIEDPHTQSIFETVGDSIYTSVMNSIEYDGTATWTKALFAAKKMYGVSFGLSAVPQVFAIAGEFVTGGLIDQVGRAFGQIYWTTGLGFMTWQAIAASLRAHILEPLEEYYNVKCRPKRMTAGDVIELWNKGALKMPDVRDRLAKEGYTESDISLFMLNSLRDLNKGEIYDLYSENLIDQPAAVFLLRRLGYGANPIMWIIKIWNIRKIDEQRGYYLGNLRKGLEEGLISEAKFREVLRRLNWGEEAIDLEIAVQKLKRSTKEKELTLSHLKSAFMKNIIDHSQVVKILEDRGFTADQISVILSIWRAELVPKEVKLSKAALIKAWTENVITEHTLRVRLKDIGYTVEDINIIISTAKARMIEPPIPIRKEDLLKAFYNIVIELPELHSRLIEIGFTIEDAKLISETAVIEKKKRALKLSASALTSAMLENIIEPEVCFEKLVKLGYSEEDAAILISTAISKAVVPPKLPTTSMLSSALKDGIINTFTFKAKLKALGYSEANIEMITAQIIYQEPEVIPEKEKPKNLTKADVKSAFMKGYLYENEVIERLQALGYSLSDSALLLTMWIDMREEKK